MSRWGKLAYLVRTGALLMCIGNFLVMCLQFDDAGWKYFTFVIPASLGQGIVYPGILFTFLAIFDHSGVSRSPICLSYPTNPEPDHAVSASTVYLIRSLGTVWGVAITSAIIQNTLSSGLSEALSGVPDKWKVTSDLEYDRATTIADQSFTRLSTIFDTRCLPSTICRRISRWLPGSCTTMAFDCLSSRLAASGSSRRWPRCLRRGRDCSVLRMRRCCGGFQGELVPNGMLNCQVQPDGCTEFSYHNTSQSFIQIIQSLIISIHYSNLGP